MKGELFVAVENLICVKYEDDDSGQWIKEGAPVIDDIVQGLPKVIDEIKKGDVFTVYRLGEEGYDDYGWWDCDAMLVDGSGTPRVSLYEKDWNGDDMFQPKAGRK